MNHTTRVPNGTAEDFFRPAFAGLDKDEGPILPALKRWAIIRGKQIHASIFGHSQPKVAAVSEAKSRYRRDV